MHSFDQLQPDTTEKENYSLDEYLHVQTFTMDGYIHTQNDFQPCMR